MMINDMFLEGCKDSADEITYIVTYKDYDGLQEPIQVYAKINGKKNVEIFLERMLAAGIHMQSAKIYEVSREIKFQFTTKAEVII